MPHWLKCMEIGYFHENSKIRKSALYECWRVKAWESWLFNTDIAYACRTLLLERERGACSRSFQHARLCTSQRETFIKVLLF